MPARFRYLAALVSVFAVSCRPVVNDFGTTTPGPRGVVIHPVPDYPFGDAVDVYRAALDLLYKDGKDRPAVIVMHDSVRFRSFGPLPGPCPQCRTPWAHKAAIDTSLIEAFAKMPQVQPRIRPFRYDIPIVLLSYQDFREITVAGQAYDSAHPRLPNDVIEGATAGEFRRRYPGAWGWADFTPVAFNRTATEALIGIFQHCGDCSSDEVVFFKKIRGRWTAIERVPRETYAPFSRTGLRYRGPAGQNPTQSQLLVDRRGSPLRADSKDGPSVYRAVLDSLYSFFGERPRMVVVDGRHAYAEGGLPPHLTRIDSSTIAAYNFLARIQDRMDPKFAYRMPIQVLSPESRLTLRQEGVELEREAVAKFENQEPTGFWRAFRKHYPNAWGYIELSRIAFNPEHTQALVFSRHRCGDQCQTGDTWFLTRKGEKWSIGERIPREEEPGWWLDSLRYIGRGADPKWYRQRRAQGVVTNPVTGSAMPFLELVAQNFNRIFAAVRTDAAGRYVLANLPLNGSVVVKSSCPIPGRTDSLHGRFLGLPQGSDTSVFLNTSRGLDTTVNLLMDYRQCAHLDRTHPLIGAARQSQPASSSNVPVEVAAVYRGVLDALYPPGVGSQAPIIVESFARDWCSYCIDAEMPRLIRQGLIDPSTEKNFAKLTYDTTPPPVFPYRRRIEVMSPTDRLWLRGDRHNWNAMKDAYPGVNAVISFSGVAFNDRRTEALVEVHADSAIPDSEEGDGGNATRNSGPETMLLRKTDTAWRVALRNVEREATSGEWSGGKCEPADAPARLPARAEIAKLVGDFRIIRVGASKEFRGRTDTVSVSLAPLRPSPRQPAELRASATLNEANGEPNEKIEATFRHAGEAATISFRQRMPEGVVMNDGWFEEHEILRTDGRSFYGRWLTVNGPSVPSRGYFCALRDDSQSAIR